MKRIVWKIANFLEYLPIKLSDWIDRLFRKDPPTYIISAGMLSYYEL